jgi:hypothetical protein
MPFKVLNSKTVIIAGESVLSEENSKNLSLNYFYLLLLNKAWKDVPINKVKKIYELLDIDASSSLKFSEDIIFLSKEWLTISLVFENRGYFCFL